MCESVLAAVEQRAQGRPVDAVTVRVSAMLRVVPEAFEQAFAMVSVGSVADGAAPEVIVVPVEGTCDDCGTTFESDDAMPVCPACSSLRVSREGGDDLVLESIRYRPTTPSQT